MTRLGKSRVKFTRAWHSAEVINYLRTVLNAKKIQKERKGDENLPCLEIVLEMNERKGMATAQRLPNIPCLCFVCSLLLCFVCLLCLSSGTKTKLGLYLSPLSLLLCSLLCLLFLAPSFFLLLSLFSPPPPLVWPLPFFFLCVLFNFFFSFLQILIDVESLFHQVLKDNKLFGVYDRLKKLNFFFIFLF